MVEIIGLNKQKQLTKEELLWDPKVQDAHTIGESIHFLKRQKPLLKVGVYIGRFDRISPKDCVFLSLARTQCDMLIVLLESSYSLRLKKEQSMVEYSEKERAFLLASLPFVDWVVTYDEESPDFALGTISPDKIFHGLYSNDGQMVTSKKDKLVLIEHPFPLVEMPRKKLDLKYFDLPVE